MPGTLDPRLMCGESFYFTSSNDSKLEVDSKLQVCLEIQVLE